MESEEVSLVLRNMQTKGARFAKLSQSSATSGFLHPVVAMPVSTPLFDCGGSCVVAEVQPWGGSDLSLDVSESAIHTGDFRAVTGMQGKISKSVQSR